LLRVFVFHPLSAATRQLLLDAGLDPDGVAAIVRMAVAEDLMGGVDVTSVATIPAVHRSTAVFGTRADGVVAGLPVAVAAVEAVCGDAVADVTLEVADGTRISRGDVVARVTAPTRLLLTAERTALNLLCHLSGVATLTRRWADALEGTPARVRDTRKTTPGLRALEKYAVRCGGGVNHRFGLADMALVKDNHVVAAGGVAAAYALVRAFESTIPVEIEVDSLDGLAEAIAAGADEVLLDNFDVDAMRAAVAYRDAHAPSVRLEASGGLTLASARSVGETGVDYIAVGELTHSARVLDLGLDLVGAA
jgi:nicotinate-nucleotide pyrophosphorylase (carboxylating)